MSAKAIKTTEKDLVGFPAQINLINISLDKFNAVPRINFRKVKLVRFLNVYRDFNLKEVKTFSVDNTKLKPYLREDKVVNEKRNLNPLRKKISLEESIPGVNLEINKEVSLEADIESHEQNVLSNDLREEEKEENVTFNLEAEMVHDEDLIISPSDISLPPSKEDVISASGDQSGFVWPPADDVEKQQISEEDEKNEIVKEEEEKSERKTKPYYLSNEEEAKKNEEIYKVKEPIKDEQKSQQTQKKQQEEHTFPWSTAEQAYEGLENIFQGGLESKLISDDEEISQFKNVPEEPSLEKEEDKVVISEPNIVNPSQDNIQIKAIFPEISIEESFESLFNSVEEGKENKIFGNIDFFKQSEIKGKVEMFNNLKTKKISPLQIMLLGGLTITLGYLICNYAFPDFFQNIIKATKEQGMSKDILRHKYVYREGSGVKTLEEGKKVVVEKPDDGIKPITEEDRLELINSAKESIESRLDPFGQDQVLPQEVIEKAKEGEKEKLPEEIYHQRKQLELVGIISTQNKNLAVINIYIADYAVLETDDSATKETKLKAAVAMAVPNRFELSLFDPVEDWTVKSIAKGKARGEDPTIELVKADKKFKLRVGQKVLLPEENPEALTKETQPTNEKTD